jgi:hypothetical protein
MVYISVWDLSQLFFTDPSPVLSSSSPSIYDETQLLHFINGSVPNSNSTIGHHIFIEISVFLVIFLFI